MKSKNKRLLLLLAATVLTGCTEPSGSSQNSSTEIGSSKTGEHVLSSAKSEEPVKLTFDVPAETTIAYYEYCTLPEVVAQDNQGHRFFPTTKVTNGDQVIEVEDGKFFVALETDYTFEYTLVWNQQTLVKKTIAKVADLSAPTINTDTTSISAFVGEEVTIPALDAEDNKDKPEDLTIQAKVLHNGSEVTVSDGKFVPTEAGVYTIEYSVTDKAGNKAEKTIELNAIAKVEGEIAYFYMEGSTGFSGIVGGWTTTLRYANDANYPGSETGTALVASSTSEVSGVKITKPAVTDLTPYNYFYVDVYNPQNELVKFYINYSYNNPYINLIPKQWTRVVAKKNASGDNYEMLKTSGQVTGDAGSGKKTIFDTTCTMSSFTEMFMGLQDATNQSLYFGSMRAVNELPSLPEGVVYATAPKVKLKGSATVNAGATSAVEFETEDAEGATLGVKVRVNGGEAVEVSSSELASYSFADAGTYEFLVTLTKDGIVIYEGSIVINAVAQEDAGEVAFFYDPDTSIAAQKLEGGWGSTIGKRTDAAYPLGNDGACLEVYTHEGAVGGVFVNNPVATDLTPFRYFYVDVYNPQDATVDFLINYEWNAPYITIPSKQWIRLVADRNEAGDNFVWRKVTGNISGPTIAHQNVFTANVPANNVKKVNLCLNNNPWKSIFLGQMRGVNTLPELPAGISYLS